MTFAPGSTVGTARVASGVLALPGSTGGGTSGNTVNGTITVAPGGTLRVDTQVNNTATSNSLGTGTVALTGGLLALNGQGTGRSTGLLGQYYQTGGIDASKFNQLSDLNSWLAGMGAPTLTAPLTGNGGIFQFTQGGSYDGNPSFSSQGFNNNGNIAVTWSGKVNIATTGSYDFYTRSDDGSMIFIDGVPVVNNNRSQGATTGTIAALPPALLTVLSPLQTACP